VSDRPPPGPLASALRRHALPCSIALLAHLPGLGGDFVLDDVRAITSHPGVNGRGPLAMVFTRTFWGQALGTPPASWRPLTTLTFALDARLFGLSPLAMHLTSLGWFLALLAVAHGFARAHLPAAAALLAACVFAAMPLHVENVASLVGRADVIALLLGLAALRSRPTLAGLAGAVLATAGALLAKESALGLVAVAAVLALAPPHGETRRDGWRRASVMTLAASLYLALRLATSGTIARWFAPDDVLAGAAPWQRAVYAVEYLSRAARLLVAPFDLCTGRKFAVVWRPATALTPAFAAGLALLALGAWSTRRALRASRPAWALCVGATGAMFTGLAWTVPEAMADRFFLAPTWFAALALAPPLLAWWQSGGARRGLVGALVALHVATGAYLSTRWRDDATLYAHAVAACPASAHNHFRYAGLLDSVGRADESAWHAALAYEAIRHFPSEWEHPAVEAEETLPADERQRRMHALLRVARDERGWRNAVAGYAQRNGMPRAAARIMSGYAPP
jgi:hypothetical protein